MIVASLSLSVFGLFVSLGCGRRELEAARVQSGAALSSLYRQSRLWSCADPGPVRSHSAFGEGIIRRRLCETRNATV